MLSSNLLKITLITVLLLASACSFWQTKTDATPSPAPLVVGEIKSEIPFLTKEPDNYQTEISITAGDIEDKTFTARNGANRLMIFDFQNKSEFALLKVGDNQTFLINRRQKIYAETESSVNISDEKGDSLKDFLTAGWLNQKNDAKFENLGTENNLTKYRVSLDDAVNSEIITLIDEKIGLPVRQEFYSLSGEQKTLTLTVELKNFSLQTEAQLFEVPKDYRKISMKEFQDILRRERLKQE